MSRIIVFLTIYLVLLGTCSFRAEFKVTHQATPSLITDKHEYVESLEGKAPQKRNRSV